MKKFTVLLQIKCIIQENNLVVQIYKTLYQIWFPLTLHWHVKAKTQYKNSHLLHLHYLFLQWTAFEETSEVNSIGIQGFIQLLFK